MPLTTVTDADYTTGPDRVIRYNAFPSAGVNGNAAPGVSSGAAVAIMEQLAREHLPPGFTFEWTDLTYQQKLTGSSAAWVFVLCVLFAYERTVLRALEDTGNTLGRYRAAVTRAETLALRHAAAERARTLAVRQYEAGGAGPLARFDAERTALAAERDVNAANTERNLALIAVYKALGGGWGMAPPTSPALAWAAP